MAAIRLERVFKSYGVVEAVKDLNLLCPDGEMMALLGPSGCGKSSTLKMIAGIESITEGEIYFDDRPVGRLEPNERNIAMVFEDYALYPHLNAFENIAFPLKLRRLPRNEIEQRVRSILDLLGLGDLKDEDVKRLSGGAQQRISIGRALVRDPELILFDEPLSHLDGNQRVLLRAEIKRLQQTTGLTAILVTHDQTEAMAMANRVAVMNAGELQQVGTPAELYERPANLFVANFIGEPPMNLLEARISSGNGRVVLEGQSWSVPLNGAIAARLESLARSRDVTVGIRPEHVELEPPANARTARLKYHEPCGDVDMLILEMGREEGGEAATRLAVETAAGGNVNVGQAFGVRFPESRLHFFDSESGRNLLMNEGGSP